MITGHYKIKIRSPPVKIYAKASHVHKMCSKTLLNIRWVLPTLGLEQDTETHYWIYAITMASTSDSYTTRGIWY